MAAKTNEDRFREVYEHKLSAARERHPDQYLYAAEEVPSVVAKMIPALRRGEAMVGPAVKAAAIALGLRPTADAIRTYLSTPTV
jgi:hypothetical protein